MNFLAGDIGGTKTLLSLCTWNNGLIILNKRKYLSKDWSTFYDILNDFLEKVPKNLSKPSFGCIGVAGPVKDGICKLTNLNWIISSKIISQQARIPYFELINDFSVLIYGLKYFKSDQFITIKQGNLKKNNLDNELITIIGAGTGLGIARGISSNSLNIVLPSEGGHSEFSPRTEKEWDLKAWLKSDLNLKYLPRELIISGRGLGNIARWKLLKENAKNHPLRLLAENFHKNTSTQPDFSSIAYGSARSGDELMKEVLSIWLSAYGSAASDIALHELCYGGLWIGGGTSKFYVDDINSPNFLDSFYNKGPFNELLKNIPLKVIIDPDAGLYSAGCRAHIISRNMSNKSS